MCCATAWMGWGSPTAHSVVSPNPSSPLFPFPVQHIHIQIPPYPCLYPCTPLSLSPPSQRHTPTRPRPGPTGSANHPPTHSQEVVWVCTFFESASPRIRGATDSLAVARELGWGKQIGRRVVSLLRFTVVVSGHADMVLPLVLTYLIGDITVQSVVIQREYDEEKLESLEKNSHCVLRLTNFFSISSFGNLRVLLRNIFASSRWLFLIFSPVGTRHWAR